MVVHLRSSLRHWMLLPAAFLLLVSMPIFAFIAFALWTVDLGRLFLGGFVLAGYCLVAALVVKLGIAIDEQMLRHERLKPDSRGNYERPLEQQPAPGMQFEMTIVGEETDSTGCAFHNGLPRTDCTGYAARPGVPHSEPLSQEPGYVARG